MSGLFQGIRYALRQLRRAPGFAVMVIAVLALGIGASVVMFGFVDAALIKPLPYGNPSRLVAINETYPTSPSSSASYFDVSYLDFLDWKNRSHAFDSMGAYALNGGFTLSTPTGAQQVRGARVSSDFFRTLAITPALGRGFYSGEDVASGPRPVILSYKVWRTRFGGKKEILGQSLTINNVPRTIIGVLPREFHFAPVGAADFWTTLQATDRCEQDRGCHNLGVVARLQDRISPQAALAEVESVAQQLQREYPDSNRDENASFIPLSQAITGGIRSILFVLMGGALLLFVIGIINATSLLLARSDARRREVAVRGALGASPVRLMGLFAVESAIIGVGASLLGVTLAQWAMRGFPKLVPADMLGSMPYLQELGLNWHILGFALGLAVIAVVVLAIVPVFRISPTELHEGLTEASRGSAATTWRSLGGNLVVIELAITTVLMVSAGLLDRSLYRLLHIDIGVQADHLATLQVKIPQTRYSRNEQVVALGRQIVSRVASLPGVESVGIANALPVSSGWGSTWFEVLGRANRDEHNETFNRQVSSGYFTTLKARLLKGRYFADAEDASEPRVVIINQTLARTYFPYSDPVGKEISYYDEPQHAMQVIGVVADIKESPLDTAGSAAIYVPFNQNPTPDIGLVVRTAQSEQVLLPTLSATIHQIDPEISTFEQATMHSIIDDSPTAYLHRAAAWLVGGYAGLAFVLGVVGLYGVVAYSVGQRTREIGVRMALGAQRGSIYRLVLREAGRLASIGLLVGILGSLGTGRLIARLLFGIKPSDAATLATVISTLLVSALLASYVPARRAAKVDPMVALRYE